MTAESGFSVGEKKRNIVTETARVVFYLTVVLYSLGSFITVLNWNLTYPGMAELGEMLKNIARVILFILLLEKFNESITRGFISLGIMAISLFCYFYSGNWGPVDLVLFFALSDHADEKGMTKMLLFFYLGLIMLLLYCGIRGSIKNVGINFSYRKGYSLGFGFPNTVGAFLLTLVILLRFTVLRGKYWLFVGACVGAALFSWFYAACRTATVVLLLYPAADIMLAYLRKGNHIKLLKGVCLIPAILAAASIGFTLYIAYSGAFPKLDGSMTARFSLPASVIRENGISLLSDSLNTGLPIDNGYIFIILRYGILWGVFFVAFFTLITGLFIRRDRVEYAAAFIMIAVHGFMESTMMLPLFNILPFFALAAGKRERPRKIAELTKKGRVVLSLISSVLCIICVMMINSPKLSDIKYIKCTYPNTSVTTVINRETSLSQTVSFQEPVKYVRLLTATFGTQPTGKYRFSLLDNENRILESKIIDGSEIKDCDLLEIGLEKNRPSGLYRMRMESLGTAEDSVALWQNETDPYPAGEAYINEEATGADWVFDYAYETEDNTWLFRGIVIFVYLVLIGFLWLI